MKTRILSIVILVCLILSFCSCDALLEKIGLGKESDTTKKQGEDTSKLPDIIEETDYVSQLKLDKSSSTVKTEATVRQFIDGDTTHFNVPKSVSSTGVLKARYIAINTPESTGKIEPYGKQASKFTKSRLEQATSIILESDDGNWNVDSTGGRHLVWVWYKTAQDQDYRCLNLEILQNGLAIASSSANNRYGQICMSAIDQAKALKLKVFSGEPDPEMYYGEAIELTLKELRFNIEEYSGKKVAFEGTVTYVYNNSAYVEAYDEETDMYYGMPVYYGYTGDGNVLNILSVGNRVRVVGSLQYYEAGGTYQVADVSYRAMKPNDPNNIQKLGEGVYGAYNEVAPATFNGTVTVIDEDTGDEKSVPYANLAMGSTISMKDLTVTKIYTTKAESSSSIGAMTLTCRAQDGTQISVRTVVLYDDNMKLITADAYQGKTIDVRGMVDYYDGTYQIKVFSANDIAVHS